MSLLIVAIVLTLVISLYFSNNPMRHSSKFMFRRFLNWFPLGMTYAFLYMGRYNLNVSKNAFGDLMTKSDFGIIFGIGTFVYAASLFIIGPMVDRIGGKKGMIIASLGAAMCNIFMGVATYVFLHGQMKFNLVVVFSILYAANMFFQSYGAVSIIKVKAYWFHVRERGSFGGIFGTLLSFGVYFAYDWGNAIIEATKIKLPEAPTAFQNFVHNTFAIGSGSIDATWFVFFVPAVILVFWSLVDMIILKDTPQQANFANFDTHDASSHEMDKEFTAMELIKRVFTNPMLLTFAMIEFCSGILRNGVLQWYPIFAHEVPQVGGEFFTIYFGITLAVTGAVGGFLSGYLSDYFFQSRRAPPALLLNAMMFGLIAMMCVVLFSQPFIVGVCVMGVWTFVIGVHSLMSGTAAADFGGRKATATASGILDGCVYVGSAVQSFAIGFLSEKSWQYWPMFILPFAAIAVVLAYRTWHALPEATKKYIATIESVEVTVKRRRFFVLKRQ